MKVLNRRRIDANDLPRFAGTALEADAIRELRAPLLDAFDVYKTNCIYGIVQESAEERAKVIEWYTRLLNLDASALTEVPPTIQRYVKGVSKR
jgi:hypothetical protein